jgi:hypothetical protein
MDYGAANMETKGQPETHQGEQLGFRHPQVMGLTTNSTLVEYGKKSILRQST